MKIYPKRRSLEGLKKSFSFSFLRESSLIISHPELIGFLLFPISFVASTICLFWVLCFPNCSWAWEVKTHKELTEQAIITNASKLNTLLVNQLGLEGGLDASINGGTPKALMIQGGDKEDDGARPFGHFHDPISNAGLRPGPFDSSIKWSLQPMGEQKWSWNDAREYYSKALTSETKAERDEQWGNTFRALGQIMHLIQDSANPAHVRNDPHLDLSEFIGLLGRLDVDGLHDYMARQTVAAYVGGGEISPDSSLLESGHPDGNPLGNLFDHNIFTGSNPDATLGSNVGVAEYTNANFFSDDTIPFQPLANFPSYSYPSLSELIPANSPFPAGRSYVMLLRLGSPSDPRARVAKYTGNQVLAKFGFGSLQYDLIGQLRLDDAVYDAYASHLIPRAVGYSAAVLDYFFRGDLRIQGSGQCYEPGLDATQFWVDFTPANPSHYQEGQGFTLYFQDSNGLWVAEDFIPVREGSMRLTGGYTGSPSTVRLAVVYDGPLGPAGAVEARGIVAKAQKITGFIDSCLQ